MAVVAVEPGLVQARLPPVAGVHFRVEVAVAQAAGLVLQTQQHLAGLAAVTAFLAEALEGLLAQTEPQERSSLGVLALAVVAEAQAMPLAVSRVLEAQGRKVAAVAAVVAHH